MRRKILIVDDSELVIAWLRPQLEGVGYDVVSARSPAEAAALVARERPAAIILDMIMPNADSGAVIRHVRRSDPARTIPVILYSGQPARRLQDAVTRYDVSGYATKKRDVSDLLAELERCISKARTRVVVPQARPPVVAAARASSQCLFVDDDPRVLRSYQRWFADKLDADFVTSPIDALGRLHAGNPPTFVVADIVMPGMSGLDLYARAVVLNDSWRSRFVFVTGSDYRELPGEAVVPVLPKPVSIERLHALIAAAA